MRHSKVGEVHCCRRISNKIIQLLADVRGNTVSSSASFFLSGREKTRNLDNMNSILETSLYY